MNLAWMLYLLVIGSVLAVAAFAVDGALKRTSIPTRWIWLAALGGIVVFAAMALRPELPRPGIVLLPGLKVTSRAASPVASMSVLERLQQAEVRVLAALSDKFRVVQVRTSKTIVRAVLMAWASATLVLVVCVLAVSAQMNDERRRWPLARIAGARVRLAPSVGPAVVGVSDPEIVVPRWLLERNTDEQRLVIVHESEHVAANDQLVMMIGWLIVVLLPWHPAVWWMMSRLRLAIELDCDARVLKHGVPARNYGTLLIDIAGQCAGHRVGALALADRTSHLERRLLAMKPAANRFTMLRVTTLGAVASLAVLAACEVRAPTSSEIASMDVAAAERIAVQARMVQGKLLYVIDGKEASGKEAHAVLAGKIASVEVFKSGNGAPAKISISTKAGGTGKPVTAFLVKRLRPDSEPASATTSSQLDAGKTRIATFSGTVADGSPRPLIVIDGVAQSQNLVITTNTNARKDAPLIVIDGVVASQAALKALDAANIRSVEVVKGNAANADLLNSYSDPAAVNGVVKIRTKTGSDAPEKP